MHWLGRIFGGHEERAENVRAAVKWLRLAAGGGDAQSQCDLGVRYHEGLGVRRDLRRAAVLYRAAAAQGDTWAQHLLSLCYRDGEGVRQSTRWARHWADRAARAR